MTKVLFLPFLQIPSGHHQVVKSIIEELTMKQPTTDCETVDILSYSYKHIEPLVSRIYLNWIHYLPSAYHWLYKKQVYQKLEEEKEFPLYERLFIPYLKKLIDKHRPNFIVCSHALPSYLACKLKRDGHCDAKILNVYTDYFIHHLWGTKEVDAHFISLHSMRDYLYQKGVSEDKIYQTGIPVHPSFSKQLTSRSITSSRNSVLLSGGSLGVGRIKKVLSLVPHSGTLHYHVLCGKNEKLYAHLTKLNHPRITPYRYISSRKELDKIYNSVDIVLTKPGGVTISECLHKRLPIMVYGYLPGQEKINVEALLKQDLITLLTIKENDEDFEQEILEIISSPSFTEKVNKQFNAYHKSLSSVSPADYILNMSIN